MTIVILLYTSTPSCIVKVLHHCTPCTVTVFTLFTHPQPIVVIHLGVTCLGQHGQPYHWYITARHVRVDMGSHPIGTSWHAMSGSTRAAILLVHLGMPCPGRHGQPSYWYILSWHVQFTTVSPIVSFHVVL